MPDCRRGHKYYLALCVGSEAASPALLPGGLSSVEKSLSLQKLCCGLAGVASADSLELLDSAAGATWLPLPVSLRNRACDNQPGGQYFEPPYPPFPILIGCANVLHGGACTLNESKLAASLGPDMCRRDMESNAGMEAPQDFPDMRHPCHTPAGAAKEPRWCVPRST